MKLLIDSGNQRIKWATSVQLSCDRPEDLHRPRQNQPIATGSADLPAALQCAFADLANPDGIWISSVAAPAVNQVLSRACKSVFGSLPVFVESGRSEKGVSSEYDRPQELGADRWSAMIGARVICGDRPVVVIDAGTAVTIDYMDAQGIFAGGVIFPGVATMIYSLDAATGQIESTTVNSVKSCLSYQNSNTRQAVENGVTLAVVAAIDHAIDHYKKTDGRDLKLILTGGDAHRLAAISKHEVAIVPDLVLIGLLALSGEDLK